MNRGEANAESVTTAEPTLPDHISSTSPIGEPRFEANTEPTLDPQSPPPILITESEVAFSTAAAARPSTPPRWRRVIGVVLAIIRRVLLPSTAGAARPRQDYPRRYAYLESACMAREMDRL
jgi:hypothetical protein